MADTDGAESDTAAAEGEPTPRSIAKDDAFHLLQTSRRRAVLRYLLAHPEQDQFRMHDIAEEVAAWEHDTTVKHLASQQRQRVYVALYQSHLPKLDDHGVITYDQSRGVVAPTALLAVFAPFLEAGLHANTQSLTLDGGASTPTETGRGGGPGLVTSLSRLFTR